MDRKAAAATMLAEMTNGVDAYDAAGRTILYLELANSFQKMGDARAPAYLKHAFESSTAMTGQNDVQQRLQSVIVDLLVQYGYKQVEELQAMSNGPGRSYVLAALAAGYEQNQRYEDAERVIEEYAGEAGFPYALATRIMLILPNDKIEQKRDLFARALLSYKVEDHKQLAVGSDDLATMIVRFKKIIPKGLLLAAIDEVLRQAKEANPGSFDLSSNEGVASLDSAYDLRLFELLPVLRELDADRAKSLLESKQNINDLLKQFPRSIQSLDQTITDAALKPGEVPRLNIRVNMKEGNGRGAEILGSMMQRQIQDVTWDAAANPAQALAKASLLPTRIGSQNLQADALQIIAEATVTESPRYSREALQLLEKKALVDVPAVDAARYLVRVAEINFKLKDTAGAKAAIEHGIKVADELRKVDENEDDPNKAPKAFWPSVRVLAGLVEIADHISHRYALETIDNINDPEAAMLMRITLADSWLGINPVIHSAIEKHKAVDKYYGRLIP